MKNNNSISNFFSCYWDEMFLSIDYLRFAEDGSFTVLKKQIINEVIPDCCKKKNKYIF